MMVIQLIIRFVPDTPFITETARGKKVMIIGSHAYVRERVRGVKSEWRCRRRTTFDKCKACVFTVDNVIVRMNTQHNHK